MCDAFITGSHAYGKPNLKSDIDLVVKMDEHTRSKLRKLMPRSLKLVQAGDPHEDPPTIRFGSLNIIPCVTNLEFAMWHYGTQRLVLKRLELGEPVSRDEAIEYLNGLRAPVGLVDGKDSAKPEDHKTKGHS